MKLRVGGVPEHFNVPWQLCCENGDFGKAGLHIEWQFTPGGSGEMRELLEEGALDVAVMLTDAALAWMTKGTDAAIVGTWVSSPLIWGVHVESVSGPKELSTIDRPCFAISRLGSGSHTMASVLSKREGWEAGPLKTEVVGTLEGARRALSDRPELLFLWEKHTTSPLVKSGEWRRIGEIPTPWAAFVLVLRDPTPDRERAVARLLSVLDAQIQGMRAKREESLRVLRERTGVSLENLEVWWEDVIWQSSPTVCTEMLAAAQRALQESDAIPEMPEGWSDSLLGTLSR